MQTTLDCSNTISEPVSVTQNKGTLQYSDNYVNYLYKHFSYEGMIANQIEQHLKEEKEEIEEIQEEDRYLQQFEGFKPKRKPQTYIRVGKKC